MTESTATFTFLLVFNVFVFSQGPVFAAQVMGSGDGEIVSGSGNGGTPATDLPVECTPEFQKEDDHTMCKKDDPRVLQVGVSSEEKKIIVDLHNSLRANVKPAATDLSTLIWDDNLAAVAQKLTQQCVMKHDRNRNVPSYGLAIGQNLAAGYRTWHTAIMGWYNEIDLYKFGQDPSTYLKRDEQIGHFTQVVNNNTYRVGCGYTRCRSTMYGSYYACNYAEGQTYKSQLEPYTRGNKCSKCPNSCRNGLCDCSGKLCLHRGKLDINTCTCQCDSIYQGPSCERLECPTADKSACWRSLLPKDCESTFILHNCPYMCGLCGGSNGATPPPVFVSSSNCTFMGKRPSKVECKQLGERGRDHWQCTSKGGKYGCSDCDRYSNMGTDFCPVMCGLCDDYCQGKTCQNGGKLDVNTCQCSCPATHTGDVCGTAKPKAVSTSTFGCSFTGRRPSKEQCKLYGNGGADRQVCKSRGGRFTCEHCSKYYNVKTEYCPVMCGYCDAPCGGKMCQNKGQLDTDKCTCTCPTPYSGATCGTVTCPKSDKWQCQFYQKAFCSIYSNVSGDCPYLCGVCSR